MFHSYYDWFQLSDNLVKSIAYIIYKMEGDNYICKKLEFTIPEHKELIFTSPLDGYKPYTGGINGLNYEQIRAVNEKYGKYIERTIPSKKVDFLVIIENDLLEIFSKFIFDDEQEIEKTLNSQCVFSEKLDGIVFNSVDLCKRFPYLKELFDKLNEWRIKTDCFTLDDNIIDSYTKEILRRGKLKIRNKY